jgi:large repetitive protein
MKMHRLFTDFLNAGLIAFGGFSLCASAQTNFGSVDVGSAATQAVTFSFAAEVKLAGIAVRTQGAANLDFTNAGGGTCATGTTYSKGAACTVKVTFKPGFAGTRDGAAVLESATGTAATKYLQGNGVGPKEPQIAFLPAAQTTIVSPTPDADGMAVDGNGNVYLAIESYDTYARYPPRAAGYVAKYAPPLRPYTETEIGSGFGSPEGIAVDGGGNLYIADFGFYLVYSFDEHPITVYVPPNVYKETLESDGSYTQSTIGSGWSSPSGAAVDGSGNVYITDTGTPVYGATTSPEVYKETLQSDGNYAQTAIGSGWSYPFGVAAGGNGDVYVADSGPDFASPAVYKLTPRSGGGYTQAAIVQGLSGTLAVDGDGDLFIADGVVYKETSLSNGSYAQGVASDKSSNYGFPGLAVDAGGNLYVGYPKTTGLLSGNLDKATPDAPPALSFAATVVGSTSKDSPKVVMIANVGDAALKFSELSYPLDFPEAASVANKCTSGTSLNPKESCAVAIDFKPIEPLGSKSSIALSESVKFTTNGLNGKTDEQTIAVSGTELKQ